MAKPKTKSKKARSEKKQSLTKIEDHSGLLWVG